VERIVRFRGSSSGGSLEAVKVRDNRQGGAGGEGRPARVIPAEARVPAAPDSGDRPGGAKPPYGSICFGFFSVFGAAFGKPAYGKPAYGKPPLLQAALWGQATFGSARVRRWRPAVVCRPPAGIGRALGRKPVVWWQSLPLRGRPFLRRQATFRNRPFLRGEAFLRCRPSLVARPIFGAGPPPFRSPRPRRRAPLTCWSGRDGTSSGAKGESGSLRGGTGPRTMVWGRHPALAALEAERPIHRIWCTPEVPLRAALCAVAARPGRRGAG